MKPGHGHGEWEHFRRRRRRHCLMAQSDPKLLYAVFKRHLVNGFGINMTEKCVFNGSASADRSCPSTCNQMKSLPSWSDKTRTPFWHLCKLRPMEWRLMTLQHLSAVASVASAACAVCAQLISRKCLQWNVFCKIRTNLHLICQAGVPASLPSLPAVCH